MIDIEFYSKNVVNKLKEESNGFDFSLNIRPPYKSLPICIIDCVYSLSAKYEDSVTPLIQKFANLCMSGDKESDGYQFADFISYVDSLENEEKSLDFVELQKKKSSKTDLSRYDRKFVVFANKLGSIRPNKSTEDRVLKSELCYNLAKMFYSAYGINTLDDFVRVRKESPISLYLAIQSMDGIGPAGSNYMFMLTGDTSLCKPDVHVREFIKRDCDCNADEKETLLLLTAATKILRENDYPNLTVRQLDYIIWNKYAFH